MADRGEPLLHAWRREFARPYLYPGGDVHRLHGSDRRHAGDGTPRQKFICGAGVGPAPDRADGGRRNQAAWRGNQSGAARMGAPHRPERGSQRTRRWSKGDSNSPSHPERQRSEGRHMGPAHRSRFRSRAAVIVTLAALPILWTPNVVVARKVVGGFRVAIPGALLFAADGWIATGYVFVWQIALTRCRATRPRGSPGLAQTLAPLAGNLGFESTSLLQGVLCEPCRGHRGA